MCPFLPVKDRGWMGFLTVFCWVVQPLHSGFFWTMWPRLG